MKKTNIHKLVFAAVLVALAVVGSLVSFPIGASKCAPVLHLVNIIGAVFLGPARREPSPRRFLRSAAVKPTPTAHAGPRKTAPIIFTRC